MTLTGFTRTCTNKSGGVRAISLARASAIQNIVFDAASRSYSAVCFTAGHGLRTYQFREDSATFSEQAVREDGVLLVKHRLQFVADPVDGATAGIVKQLAQASSLGGMIAIVETQAGERLLVGYSETFGLEQPLRLTESAASTQARRGDSPIRTFVLASADDSPALPFSGDLP